MPSAISSEREPVGMASTFMVAFWPRRITAPLPNCFSIWLMAVSRAFCLSLGAGAVSFAFFSMAMQFPPKVMVF